MSKIDTSTEAPVTLTYTNWKGETAQRRIIPRRIWWGSTEWHPEPQWLLTALDVDKGEDRDFALKDFGQPVTVQDAARDADLLLSAYSAVIVLHRMLRRAGLARGIAVAQKIADEIGAAHPEFPGLTALRAITEGRE